MGSKVKLNINYYLQTEGRLSELKNTIHHMQNSNNAIEIESAFGTFLDIGKNLFCPLHKYSKKLPGYDDWWNEKAKNLEQDSTAKFFYQWRNHSIKGAQALLEIRSISPKNNPGSVQIQGPLMIDERLGIFDDQWPRFIPKINIPPMEIVWDFSEKPRGSENLHGVAISTYYIDVLEKTVIEFAQKFVPFLITRPEINIR